MFEAKCNNCGRVVDGEGECKCGCLVNAFGQVLQSLDFTDEEKLGGELDDY